MKKIYKMLSAFFLATALVMTQPDILPFVQYSVSAATLAAPTSSLDSGTYQISSQKYVKLTCAQKKARIYYSINGAKYRQYKSAIRISRNTTIKFYSKFNGKKSKIVSRSYKLTPEIRIRRSGDCPVRIFLYSPVQGAEIYYTTDGTKPTKSSARFTTSELTLTRSCTLRAMVCVKNWSTYYLTEKIDMDSPQYAASYLNNYTSKYYYKQLKGNERTVYERVYEAARTFTRTVDVRDLNMPYDDVYHISQMVGIENPQLFWLDGRSYDANCYWIGDVMYASEFYLDYLRTKEEADKIAPLLEEKAHSIVCEAQKEGSVFLCVKYIHDYIIDNTVYNSWASEYSDGAVGNHADEVLLEGTAVCAGYARALDYLLQMAGISDIAIVGGTSEGQHMWNRVKIGEHWYNIDTTWDDNDSRYEYFCLTDSEFSVNHTPRPQLHVENAPADSTEYSFLNGMGVTVYNTVDEAAKGAMKLLAEGYNQGQRNFTFYFRSGLGEALSKRLTDDFYTLVNGYGAYPDSAKWWYYSNYINISVV